MNKKWTRKKRKFFLTIKIQLINFGKKRWRKERHHLTNTTLILFRQSLPTYAKSSGQKYDGTQYLHRLQVYIPLKIITNHTRRRVPVTAEEKPGKCHRPRVIRVNITRENWYHTPPEVTLQKDTNTHLYISAKTTQSEFNQEETSDYLKTEDRSTK